MSSIQILVGTKEQIPEECIEHLFVLQQMNRKEFFHVIPPLPLQYFQKAWFLSEAIGTEKLWILALDSSRKLVGYGQVSWNVAFDNLNQAWFWVYVLREERRQGYGTAILKAIENNLPSQIDFLGSSCLQNSAGQLFLKSLGGKLGYEEVLRVSKLMDFNLTDIQSITKNLRQEARNKGFEIFFVDGLNLETTLKERGIVYRDYVKMVERIWSDMPKEELSEKNSVLSIDRYSDMITRMINLGNKLWFYIVIDTKSNSLAGYTFALINQYSPTVARQDDTGVLTKYRGNNLGLTLKYMLLEKLLTDSRAKYWITGNASRNTHIVRINRILKHKIWDSECVFEFDRNSLKKITSLA